MTEMTVLIVRNPDIPVFAELWRKQIEAERQEFPNLRPATEWRQLSAIVSAMASKLPHRRIGEIFWWRGASAVRRTAFLVSLQKVLPHSWKLLEDQPVTLRHLYDLAQKQGEDQIKYVPTVAEVAKTYRPHGGKRRRT
jgi:hypothetical protein